MRRSRLWFLVLLLALIPTTGCNRPPATDNNTDPNLLAVVGSREIRIRDLTVEMERRRQTHQPLLDKKDLLDEMILREALVQKALQRGLDQDPAIRRAYENLLISKLKQRELEPRLKNIELSNAEIQAHARQSTRAPGPKSQLAMLHLRTYPQMSTQKLERLKARFREAREAALRLPTDTHGFGNLAADYSEDQGTRYSGGDIGWFEHTAAKYEIPSEVLEAGFRLSNPGDISDVIETKTGLYLVKLIARTELTLPPDETLARHQLLLRERKETESRFCTEAKSLVNIQVFTHNLEKALLDTSPPTSREPSTLPAQ